MPLGQFSCTLGIRESSSCALLVNSLFVQCMQVGEFGYLLFPNVESDVLKSFGQSNSFMNFARIGMAVVMYCFHAPALLELFLHTVDTNLTPATLTHNWV